jgi:hypothetical protein
VQNDGVLETLLCILQPRHAPGAASLMLVYKFTCPPHYILHHALILQSKSPCSLPASFESSSQLRVDLLSPTLSTAPSPAPSAYAAGHIRRRGDASHIHALSFLRLGLCSCLWLCPVLSVHSYLPSRYRIIQETHPPSFALSALSVPLSSLKPQVSSLRS